MRIKRARFHTKASLRYLCRCTRAQLLCQTHLTSQTPLQDSVSLMVLRISSVPFPSLPFPFPQPLAPCMISLRRPIPSYHINNQERRSVVCMKRVLCSAARGPFGQRLWKPHKRGRRPLPSEPPFPLFSLVASSYRFVRPRVFLQCEHTRRHARRGGGDGGGGGGGHARGRHFHPGVRATAQPEPKR